MIRLEFGLVAEQSRHFLVTLNGTNHEVRFPLNLTDDGQGFHLVEFEVPAKVGRHFFLTIESLDRPGREQVEIRFLSSQEQQALARAQTIWQAVGRLYPGSEVGLALHYYRETGLFLDYKNMLREFNLN